MASWVGVPIRRRTLISFFTFQHFGDTALDDANVGSREVGWSEKIGE